MSAVTVCPKCRDTCAKCHSFANPSNSHGLWACNDCKKEFKSKCCVCGGSKNGPGSSGTGKICKKCYKINTCPFCGDKI